MTKQDRKTLRKFALLCTLTDKSNVKTMYFTLKDLYFTKVLNKKYIADYGNYIFYPSFDKLPLDTLSVVYACVCRCCKVRKINVYEDLKKKESDIL